MELKARRITLLRVMEEQEKDLVKEVNKLKRLLKKEIDQDNLFLLQDYLLNVYDWKHILTIHEWEELLDQDEEGEIICSERGGLGARYAPDNLAFKEKKAKLDKAMKADEHAVSKFFVSLTRREHNLIRNQDRELHLQDLQLA